MPVQVSIDLRDKFAPARDQKQRPTCMAFAASDAHSAARGTLELLSTEFAFYQAVRRRYPLDPNSGVSFSLIAQGLHEDGQPLETNWPYLSVLPTNLKDWKPPATCVPTFRRAYQIEGPSIGNVYSRLDDSRPVVLTMTISKSFFRPSPEGIITASASEPPVNTHAVVAVGYGKNKAHSLVLIRNSWGDRWGIQGHAFVTEDYLKPRLLTIGTADLKEA
jgi:C1A family cysteine protease